jgi:hypothetical protein
MKDFTEKAPAGAPILGGANIFHVIEWVKERFRVITHSYDANEKKFPKLKLPSLAEVRESVHKGEFTLCLDMSSWFSQFPLSEAVRNANIYKHGDELYRWVRLAMGFRGACHIAEAALLRIMARASKCVPNSLGFIDNVKFDGSFNEVLEAGIAFMEDCVLVNATVNEISVKDWQTNQGLGEEGKERNQELVKEQICQRITFLGLDVDHQKKTAAIAEKTIKKIKLVWSHRDNWSLHDFNAYVSLLCFAMYATGMPLHPFFETLSVHRLVAHFGAFHTDAKAIKSFWSAKFDFLPEVFSSMQNWTDFCLDLGDVPCPVPGNNRFTGSIFFDSCAEGYGIIKCEGVDIQTFSGKWPTKILHSTSSEPMGVMQLAEHVAHLPPGSSWLVILDHTPAVVAVNKGHGRSFMNNTMVNSLHHAFPGVSFKAIHIPGWVMPADPISRGVQLAEGGLRKALMLKLVQSINTGETGFSYYVSRPASTDPKLSRIDFANRLSRDEQEQCIAALLDESKDSILLRSSLDK